MVAPSRSFLCIRHGVTDWNRQGRFQGLTDIPLNDDGIAQARAAAQRLQDVPVDIIVSSPLVRAVTTAEIIAAGKPLEIDAGLIECDFGSLEGQSIREAMDAHGITGMKDLVSLLPPDGEAWVSVSERALRCVGTWLNRHPQAALLFVCHDAVMQAMCNVLCGHWFENRHGVPFRFTRTGDKWTIDEV